MTSASNNEVVTECPYYIVDIYDLIGAFPFRQIGSHFCARQIRNMRQSGDNYFKFLGAYPQVKCEPLDFHYLCKRCIDTLDAGVMHALLHQMSRSADIGVFLLLLAPHREFRKMLMDVRSHLKPWLLELALSCIDGRMPTGQEAQLGDLEQIRRQLAQLPSCQVPLRPAISKSQEEQMRQEADVIRKINKAGGADAVLAHLPGTLRRYYSQSHKTWLAGGAKPWQPIEA